MIYLTSYCNHGHFTDTGLPVNHECIRLPVEFIEAEQSGNIALAIRILESLPASKRKTIKPKK
jgi:hypothetical protein